jgi:hypothetical protein
MTILASGPAGSATDADALYAAFSGWVEEQGITLYPAQDEAILEMVTGTNVVLATPTGSGKSLVAVAAHYFAMAAGIRSVYTAPIKALVSEKFFALCAISAPTMSAWSPATHRSTAMRRSCAAPRRSWPTSRCAPAPRAASAS